MVKASVIAEFLNTELIGDDIEVVGPCSLSNVESNKCVFIKEFNEMYLELLSNRTIFAILPPLFKGIPQCSYVISDNPRLSMAKVIAEFFQIKKTPIIAKTAIISQDVKLGKDVYIGEYCILDGDITIGDRTTIGHHVRIEGETVIGHDCCIKSGVSIGEEGFGFERNENGINIHFPQIGRIEIGNNVSIGANSTVERAALDVTRIEDGVAVDDLTQVGHNVHIGKGTTIANGAVLCGGVIVGQGCNIAPNACVRQRVRIGNDVIVGLGAVVLKDIPDNAVYAGNPAKRLEKK